MIQQVERAQKWLGLVLTFAAIVGAFVYMGQRSERDRIQTEMLERMSVDLRDMVKASHDTSTQIQVLSARISALESRIQRLESGR